MFNTKTLGLQEKKLLFVLLHFPCFSQGWVNVCFYTRHAHTHTHTHAIHTCMHTHKHIHTHTQRVFLCLTSDDTHTRAHVLNKRNSCSSLVVGKYSLACYEVGQTSGEQMSCEQLFMPPKWVMYCSFKVLFKKIWNRVDCQLSERRPKHTKG